MYNTYIHETFNKQHDYSSDEQILSLYPSLSVNMIKNKYSSFWKRQNYGNGKKISGCQGFSKKGRDE